MSEHWFPNENAMPDSMALSADLEDFDFVENKPKLEAVQLTSVAFCMGVGMRDTHALTLSDGKPNPSPDAGKPYGTINGKQIVRLVKNAPAVPKDDAQWFIPSTYHQHDARTAEAQFNHGSFGWLPIDIDDGNLDLSEVKEAICGLLPGISVIIYSTRSSTPQDRRWRVLVPLATFLLGVDYVATLRAFHGLVSDQSMGTVIPCGGILNEKQIIYLPNRGDFYEYEIITGKRLDITPDHPITVRREANRERDAKAAGEAAAEAKARREKRERERLANPAGESPVDVFNAAHEVEDLLQRYGYTRQGSSNHWRSPQQTSGSFATRCDGGHWVSLSGSDAAAGIGNASRSGSRYGDAFDLFVFYEHGGDFTAAVRAYGKEIRKDDIHIDPDEESLDDFDRVDEPAPDAPHPMAKFIDPLPDQTSATEFVIDGVLAAGMTLLAGGWGAGKTSQLVPLLARVGWLCKQDDPLRPKLRRTVIYISEDVGQVQRILGAMASNGDLGADLTAVQEYFRVVQAERISAEDAVKVAKTYAYLTVPNTSQETGVTYDAKPLIVFDTRSAAIDLRDENDNTEASRVVATLRRGFPGFPILIVGHLSKALKRADTANMSGRGAGAWEADAQQVLYLMNDEGQRYLDVGTPKHRFTSGIDGISFESVRATVRAVDVLGDEISEDVFYGSPTVVGMGERKKRKEEEAKARDADQIKAMRGAILDIARTWRSKSVAINRTVLCEATGKQKQAAVDCINKLIHEGWLVEMPIPQNVRKNPKQSSYIIGLTPQERDAHNKDGALPAGADNAPAAFTKPKVVPKPSVPDPEADTSEKGKTGGFEPSSGGVG
jgi:hypothetical protein